MIRLWVALIDTFFQIAGWFAQLAIWVFLLPFRAAFAAARFALFGAPAPKKGGGKGKGKADRR